jgi:hypothetical protein
MRSVVLLLNEIWCTINYRRALSRHSLGISKHCWTALYPNLCGIFTSTSQYRTKYIRHLSFAIISDVRSSFSYWLIARCHCCEDPFYSCTGEQPIKRISMPQDVLQNHAGKPPKSKRINIPRAQSNTENEIHNIQSHSFRSDLDGDSIIPPLFR